MKTDYGYLTDKMLDKNGDPNCPQCKGTGEIQTPDRARGGHYCPCTFKENRNTFTPMKKKDQYEIYYDRQTKSWWAFWTYENGMQKGDAVNAYTKEQCLIYLGMAFKGVQNEN